MKYTIESDAPIIITKSPKLEKPTGRIFPGYNFDWSEVLNDKDTDWPEYLEHRDKILLLSIMLQEYRALLKKPIRIESWFRSKYYNNIDLPSRGYKSSKTSDHLEGRAVDTDVAVSNTNIETWKKVCQNHNVYYSYGLYQWGMHLGYRFDKCNQWDNR